MLLIRLHWTMFVNYPRRRRQSKAFNRVWTHAITRHIHSMNFIRSVRCPGNLLIGLHWLKCLKIPSTWGFVGLCHMSQSYDPSDAKRIFSSDMPPNMCWVVAMLRQPSYQNACNLPSVSAAAKGFYNVRFIWSFPQYPQERLTRSSPPSSYHCSSWSSLNLRKIRVYRHRQRWGPQWQNPSGRHVWFHFLGNPIIQQLKLTPGIIIFSCPEQLNRWPCH